MSKRLRYTRDQLLELRETARARSVPDSIPPYLLRSAQPASGDAGDGQKGRERRPARGARQPTHGHEDRKPSSRRDHGEGRANISAGGDVPAWATDDDDPTHQWEWTDGDRLRSNFESGGGLDAVVPKADSVVPSFFSMAPTDSTAVDLEAMLNSSLALPMLSVDESTDDSVAGSRFGRWFRSSDIESPKSPSSIPAVVPSASILSEQPAVRERPRPGKQLFEKSGVPPPTGAAPLSSQPATSASAPSAGRHGLTGPSAMMQQPAPTQPVAPTGSISVSQLFGMFQDVPQDRLPPLPPQAGLMQAPTPYHVGRQTAPQPQPYAIPSHHFAQQQQAPSSQPLPSHSASAQQQQQQAPSGQPLLNQHFILPSPPMYSQPPQQPPSAQQQPQAPPQQQQAPQQSQQQQQRRQMMIPPQLQAQYPQMMPPGMMAPPPASQRMIPPQLHQLPLQMPPALQQPHGPPQGANWLFSGFQGQQMPPMPSLPTNSVSLSELEKKYTRS
eukprot:TRINITY_DN12713_c0_g1_i1.p1 TRINITY_DN12713_c0_g1~~TRINITY_DN12713_c0_g1_i1.p1  ORF type:complete len:499 (-),score=113.04 TRINITY_DN12713_c0_g1_i1:1372-2868(-)